MKKWILLIILALAFVLRFYNLSHFPVGFTPDEASFGYDAYSILMTGRDQWGKSFPLVLESFGDFKSPLYAYLTIPSVAIFGLSEFSTRLPNALLGTLAVLVLYLLCLEIKKYLGSKNSNLEIIACLLLTVSPWHIMLSRGAFEANLITFFIPLGLYLFFKNKYNWSFFVFGLSLFSYHSAKLIVPLIFVFLLIVFKFKKVFPILIFGAFFGLMLYSQTLGGAVRIKERSITQGALEEGAKIKIDLIQKGTNPIIARLLHNKYQVTASRFINNYSQYLSFKFLISQGAAETTYGMIPGMGVVGISGLILLLGLTSAFKKNRKLILILFAWFLVSPIPAALSTGVGYSANRTCGMIIPLIMLESIGALGLYEHFIKYKNYLIPVFGAFILFNLYLFTSYYFSKSPQIAAHGMLYGNMEIAKWVNDKKPNGNIIVDKSLSEPHIYFAFASKMDPKLYQEATEAWKYTTWVDQMEEYGLSNFVFKDIKKADLTNNNILIGKPSDFPESFLPDKIIYFPDGKPAIYAKNI